MRVIFMGTPEFAVASLNKLLQSSVNIIAVVTVPDKPKGRGLQLQSSAVKNAALKANLPVLQPEKLKDPQFVNEIHRLKPDLIIVVAFRILPEEIFSIPPSGTVNLHGSILPRYRGAAPINWAIINGEKVTGATTFCIKKEVDTGNIIDHIEIPITPDMTAGELHDIMAVRGAELLVKTCKMIESGKVSTRAQDDCLATNAPKIFKDQCVINFNQPAEAVHNFIRGLSPYPSAYTFLNEQRLRLFSSSLVDTKSVEKQPGTVLEITENARMNIQCNPGFISIGEVQLEGKKRLALADFLRGSDLPVGFRFGK